ncbi:MAG TPA: hypothetical protein VIE91_07685 [Methylophilaceae bacterium]
MTMIALKPSDSGDSFATLRIATERLADALQPLMQADLLELERSCRPHLEVLIEMYVETQKQGFQYLGFEYEEQLWITVRNYLKQLTKAYTTISQQLTPDMASIISGKVLQQSMDSLALYAKWHYLRYQLLPARFWLQMHAVYLQAEQTKTNDEGAGNACSRYLQALMLDTLNHSNMLKSEIAQVDEWLSSCCQDLSLDKDCDENRHQYFVDLKVDHSARRIRDFTTKPSRRYWHVDSLADSLEVMRTQLESDILPPIFVEGTAIPNAIHLVELLEAEWSQKSYKRQRRTDERENVSKLARAVNGIHGVCQHVKNLAFSTMSPLPARAHDTENGWIIENESKFGFGALVNAGSNLWLKPGCLIALDYELNPDMTVVGVVRSIQQQPDRDCYVGIEVLSHTPIYVRMQQMEEDMSASGSAEPFPALYLGKDDERELPATLVMPSFEYVPGGSYALKTQQFSSHVRLGEVLEQQGEWLRVVADVGAEKG